MTGTSVFTLSLSILSSVTTISEKAGRLSALIYHRYRYIKHSMFYIYLFFKTQKTVNNMNSFTQFYGFLNLQFNCMGWYVAYIAAADSQAEEWRWTVSHHMPKGFHIQSKILQSNRKIVFHMNYTDQASSDMHCFRNRIQIHTKD